MCIRDRRRVLSPFVTPKSNALSPCPSVLFDSPLRCKNISPTEIKQSGRYPGRFFGKLLILCVMENNPKGTKLNLDKGADPNYENEDGFTPLYLAVKFDYVECVHLLLSYGALIARRPLNSKFKTPLELVFDHSFARRISDGSTTRMLVLAKLSKMEAFITQFSNQSDDSDSDVAQPPRKRFRPATAYVEDIDYDDDEEDEDEAEDENEQEEASTITPHDNKNNIVIVIQPDQDQADSEVDDSVPMETADGPDIHEDDSDSDKSDSSESDEDSFEDYTLEELKDYCKLHHIGIDFDSDDRDAILEAISQSTTRKKLWQILADQLTSSREQLRQYSEAMKSTAKRLLLTFEAPPSHDEITQFAGAIRQEAQKRKKEWWELSSHEIENLKTWEWFVAKGTRTSKVSQIGLQTLNQQKPKSPTTSPPKKSPKAKKSPKQTGPAGSYLEQERRTRQAM
eukprot:TRINITY_DN2000_c0_g1_i1.p1 TRINITY_DN2000_c0_g1~~TRINITY_DN2000_c0_g1_i1.p1  ORF type:complete len:454 (-),score=87.55 TRINITY_DN2000_c0_g1_i1:1018-2379(-)